MQLRLYIDYDNLTGLQRQDGLLDVVTRGVLAKAPNSYVDRLSVDGLKGTLEDSNPLSDDQAKQLLNVMVEERAKNPPLANRDDAENTLKKFDGEARQQFFQAEEQMNQQVFLRAAAFLSPPQMEALTKSQAATLASQKKEFELEQRLFGEKTN